MKNHAFGWMALVGASAILLSLAGSLPAYAQQKQHGHPHKPPALQNKAAKKSVLICPVTGDKIASVKAAVGHSTYKGTTYYFCCPECKPRFDKNPAKYVKNAAQGKFEKM